MTGFSGVCDRMVLLVKLALEERQVVKNWSGEKMCVGGDSGGSFPACFSVLNSVFQKEVYSV